MIGEVLGEVVASVLRVLWFAANRNRDRDAPAQHVVSTVAQRSMRGAYRSWARALGFEHEPFGYGGTLRNRHVSIRTGVEGEAVFDVRIAIALSHDEHAAAESFARKGESKAEELGALCSLVSVDARQGKLRLTLPPMTPPDVTEEALFATLDMLETLATSAGTTPYRGER